MGGWLDFCFTGSDGILLDLVRKLRVAAGVSESGELAC